jgi:hypothetical protein
VSGNSGEETLDLVIFSCSAHSLDQLFRDLQLKFNAAFNQPNFSLSIEISVDRPKVEKLLIELNLFVGSFSSLIHCAWRIVQLSSFTFFHFLKLNLRGKWLCGKSSLMWVCVTSSQRVMQSWRGWRGLR